MLRPKFKHKLFVFFIWFTTFFHNAYANQFNIDQSLTSSCKESFDQLDNLNQLNNQLGAAYLTANEALKQVYATFGKRLSSAKSPEEISEISLYFLRSAKTLQEAEKQNNQSIADLSLKTKELKDELSKCFLHTAVVAGLEPLGSEVAQILDAYVPGNLIENREVYVIVSGQMHPCGKWDGANITSSTDFTHEISASTSFYNCSYPAQINRVTFQKEISLGKLAVGHHILKVSLGYNRGYKDIAFEVKP